MSEEILDKDLLGQMIERLPSIPIPDTLTSKVMARVERAACRKRVWRNVALVVGSVVGTLVVLVIILAVFDRFVDMQSSINELDEAMMRGVELLALLAKSFTVRLIAFTALSALVLYGAGSAIERFFDRKDHSRM